MSCGANNWRLEPRRKLQDNRLPSKERQAIHEALLHLLHRGLRLDTAPALVVGNHVVLLQWGQPPPGAQTLEGAVLTHDEQPWTDALADLVTLGAAEREEGVLHDVRRRRRAYDAGGVTQQRRFMPSEGAFEPRALAFSFPAHACPLASPCSLGRQCARAALS